jgi:hypothetical protein
MSRADQPFLHGRCGLDGHKLIHQGGIDAAAKLRERLR